MADFFFGLPALVQALAKGAAVVLVIFPVAAACSMAERKVCAWIQSRPGPNRAVPPILAWIPGIGIPQRLGLFQLAADGGKFLFKEEPLPDHVHRFYYTLAPVVAMVPAFTTITVVPLGAYIGMQGRVVPLMLANVDVGMLAVFAVASLGIYSLILAGWASNSKYPFLGGVRASAQLISYELSMTLSVLPVFLWVNAPGSPGTLSLVRVVEFQSGHLHSGWGGAWFLITMPVSAFIFAVALFAETNRQPFDMPESESDLVGGFHTEYGAFKWSLFFVAEYANMIVGSAVFALLFLGGWNVLPWVPLASLLEGLHRLTGSALWLRPLVAGIISMGILGGKVLTLIFIFMWVRWTVPRFRYDQVMRLGWQKLLPLSIANLIAYTVGIYFLQG
jgi:NADH-quinone oxidoreductase subunit H